MAEEITPGTILRYRDLPWRVDEAEPITDPPEHWGDQARRGAVRVTITALSHLASHRTGQLTIPGGFRRSGTDATVLARASTEGHYPVCGVCAQAWPCRHEADRQIAARAAEQIVARLENEAAKPHVCRWCALFEPTRGNIRRFATKGGRTKHTRSCRANPGNWDLEDMVPLFTDTLKLAGGVARQAVSTFDNDLVAVAAAVRAHAEAGTLPATLEEIRDGL